MRIVSLFEAEWECGEKPLETIETPFNMFTLGKDCINHGMSTSWNTVLQTDEEREIQDRVHRMTPCFIQQNYQKEKHCKHPKSVRVSAYMSICRVHI